MKKRSKQCAEIPTSLGKPPAGTVFQRVTAAALGPEFFRNAPKTPVAFKQTTHEDFLRIIAEFSNRSEHVD
nr:hypothetical protein [uncultured Duganella sp.]